MADSTSPIQQITAGLNADARVNENFDAASPSMIYGRRAAATTGLTWGYYGGRYSSLSVANGTLTLTASATNYVVANKTTGAVSVSTSNTNWNDTAGYERCYLVTTGTSTVSAYEDHRQLMGGAGAGGGSPMQCIPIACSDESTPVSVGGSKVTFRMPYAFILSSVRASLTNAQASGSIFTVDINEAGVTILSTKLTIDNTEKTSTTAAIPAVISDVNLADDAEITIDVDQIGNGTATGLKVYLIGAKA